MGTIDTILTERVWSQQQQDIYSDFRSGTSNVVVVARAGVGKTTTAIEGIRYAPEPRILMTAFNNKTADDLNKKLAESGNIRATAKTTHALGFSIVRKFRSRLKVDNDNRADNLTNAVCGNGAPDTIKRLVTKLHTQGRENAPHATKVGELTVLAIKFECEPDEQWSNQGFDLDYVETKALAAMAMAANVQSGESIDYSDMIFLPVRNGWMSPQYDLVVIDEAQDLTLTQLEIAQGVVTKQGRIFVIGDDRQAIYAFRGADSESLGRLKTELEAKELKLTTTYRCAKAIVREAQKLVPDFEAGENNPEGEVLYLQMEKLVNDAAAGNFILSRTNAPLVSIAMKLLRMGKRTRILGKDIGAGLKSLIRRFKGRSVPDLLAKITTWEAREIARISVQLVNVTNGRAKSLQAKMEGISDQASMLTSLADGARNVDEVTDRIDSLFTDDGKGDAGVITCSSVHKAKGLEADKVFVLADTLKSYSQEELNIHYVAITRAKETLVYVSDTSVEPVEEAVA